MSNIVHKLVLDRKVGTQTRKSLLLYMAYRASDDGSGVWVSKPRIARELEMGERTVQKCTKELLDLDLISAIGRRRCASGYTTVYQLNLKSIIALDLTNGRIAEMPEIGEGDDPQGVHEVHPFRATHKRQEVQDVHPTGSPYAPQEVQGVHPNQPLTIQESVCSTDADHHTHPFFEDFWKAYPNRKDRAGTERAFALAIKSGVNIQVIVSAAKACAEENQGNGRQFLKHSANWLKSKGWLDYGKQAETPSTTADLANLYADRIRTGKRIFGGPLKPEVRKELQSRHGLDSKQIDAALAAA